MSHNTNKCKTFHQQIQSAIEQGRIKFENPTKLMKIDGHLFPANMVEVSSQDVEGMSKELTSKRAKQTGVVGPKMQISADRLKSQSRYDQG
jgi:hypothetical protein